MDNDLYLQALEEQNNQKKQAYDETFNMYRDVYNQQKQQMPQVYNQARGQAYTAAKKSAISANEYMADAGLAGNLYSSPISGYSETSRLQQDLNLQNTLNSISAEERQAALSLQNALAEAYSKRGSYFAELNSELYGQKANYIQNQQQNALNMAQQYAQSGQDLPEYYKQHYEQAAGTSYGDLLKQFNPSAYTRFYELDDTEKTLYDKYITQNDGNSWYLFNDYFKSDSTMTPEQIAKILKATGQVDNSLPTQLITSGFVSNSNKDKAEKLYELLGITETAPTLEEVEMELAVDGKINGLTLKSGSTPISNPDMEKELKSKQWVHLNGQGYSNGELPNLNNIKNGDIVKWSTNNNPKGKYDDYVYYNGYWFFID